MVREGANFMAQSTVADKINKEGMGFMWQNPEMFKDFEIINQMHDSLLLQVPLKVSRLNVAKALIALRESLGTSIMYKNASFKIPIGMSVGFNFMNYKKGVNNTGLQEVDIMGSSTALSLALKLNMCIIKLKTARATQVIHG